jgi:YrbI family 3-deoxy-D-manno-octulosonate 8-phosphate phosphatase
LVLEENGSIYIFKPWVLREHGSRLGGRIAVYVQDPLRSFQADEPDDLDMLRRLAPLALGMAAPLELNAIRILALDFDGVMTDNRVIVGEDGVESVLCHRGDGWGIARLVEAGVQVVVVSTEVNPVVAARCRKLGIECIHGVTDKLAALKEWVSARGAHAEQVAYVGNDVNDKDCLGWVGAPIVVADASEEARRLARYVTTLRGGDGAVREVADWLLAARKAARRPS